MYSIDEKSLKIGVKLIDYGEVLSIAKIHKKEITGKKIPVLRLRPHYKTNSNKTLVYSVPVINLKNGTIRRLLDKKSFKKILIEELNEQTMTAPASKTDAKEILKNKSPRIAIKLLKCMWIEQQISENFTKGKKDMLQLAIDRLVQEYAFIHDIPLEEAEKKLLKTIKKNVEIPDAPEEEV